LTALALLRCEDGDLSAAPEMKPLSCPSQFILWQQRTISRRKSYPIMWQVIKPWMETVKLNQGPLPTTPFAMAWQLHGCCRRYS